MHEGKRIDIRVDPDIIDLLTFGLFKSIAANGAECGGTAALLLPSNGARPHFDFAIHGQNCWSIGDCHDPPFAGQLQDQQRQLISQTRTVFSPFFSI